MTMTIPMTTASRRDPDEASTLTFRPCGQSPDDAPLTDAERVHLRIRVIALEGLVIALLADASGRQLALARGMANHISPRAGFSAHPVTLQAADEMLSLVDRAYRYPRSLLS